MRGSISISAPIPVNNSPFRPNSFYYIEINLTYLYITLSCIILYAYNDSLLFSTGSTKRRISFDEREEDLSPTATSASQHAAVGKFAFYIFSCASHLFRFLSLNATSILHDFALAGAANAEGVGGSAKQSCPTHAIGLFPDGEYF